MRVTKAKVLNVKISQEDHKRLEELVESGRFLSISDAVRTAIRRLLDLEIECKSVVEINGNNKETVLKEAD